MSRAYNFSAGPAVLPEEVLREAAEEMLDYKGSGMSVMEMSHRSKTYDAIIKGAEADLRTLLQIQFLAACHKRHIHERAVFFSDRSCKKLTLIQEII